MNLISIWSLPSYPLRERLRRTREWAAMTAASKIPLRIKYWAAVQQIAAASTVDPKKVVPEMDLEYIMRNMPQPTSVA